jgi:hypothetical protein
VPAQQAWRRMQAGARTRGGCVQSQALAFSIEERDGNLGGGGVGWGVRSAGATAVARSWVRAGTCVVGSELSTSGAFAAAVETKAAAAGTLEPRE